MSAAGDLIVLGYTVCAVLAFVGLALIVVMFVARIGIYRHFGSTIASRFEDLMLRLAIERTARPNFQRLAWAYTAVLAPLLAIRLDHLFAEIGSFVVPILLVVGAVALQAFAIRQATRAIGDLPSA